MSANRNHNTNHAPYPQRGQGRLAFDNMPEDLPEYGEDGLHMLNNEHSQEHLADEVVVGASDADGKTKGSKKLESPSLTDDGEPAAKGNKQQSAYMDIAQQIIEADQRNREDRVWRRRHTTNPVLRALQVIMPYGGILASAFSIASSTIGGGIIGLPAAFQMSGMGMAIIFFDCLGDHGDTLLCAARHCVAQDRAVQLGDHRASPDGPRLGLLRRLRHVGALLWRYCLVHHCPQEHPHRLPEELANCI
ncbi:amino acid transporter, putative [Leishmania donovani]|uniref:Amino acid transporter, putative n=1 Tax=Leishmania donovani TaxID=5661 RepID=A0A3S7X428_LEIDO|nr:amino acid transporter, putative [Leishmania donovani]